MTPVLRTFQNPKELEYSASGNWWHDATLSTLLDCTPRRKDLIVGSETRLSTDDVRERVRALAGWLRSRGIRRGDAVSWQLPNHPEVVCLYLATWQLGAIAVPFHQGLSMIEARRVLNQVGDRLLVLGADALPLAEAEETIVLPMSSPLSGLDGSFVEVHEAEPADAAIILTTSGSSGRPKSVVHSQRTLTHKARQLATLHGTTVADAVLVPVPLAHMAGLLHGALHPIATGIKAVIQDKWNPDEALELVANEKVTMLFGPPIFSIGLSRASAFNHDKVESIRLIASGATPITEAYVERTSELFGCAIKRTYGSTEAPIVCNTFPEDPPEKGWTTDGRTVPGVELQIRDPSTGQVVGPNVVGEVWLRGPELCDGYLDEHDTASVFVDGWMYTQDLASMDQDGFIQIAGRSSSIIIRGGMNISAREVETALSSHPHIQEAVVLGAADELYGECVVAFVATHEKIDRKICEQWLIDRGLAKYKVPDRIIALSEIPVLPTYQKPDLAALRALL